jgi:hypothetical protein
MAFSIGSVGGIAAIGASVAMPVVGAALITSFACTFLKGFALALLAQGKAVFDSFGSWEDSLRKIKEKQSSIGDVTQKLIVEFKSAGDAERKRTFAKLTELRLAERKRTSCVPFLILPHCRKQNIMTFYSPHSLASISHAQSEISTRRAGGCCRSIWHRTVQSLILDSKAR